MRPIQLWLPKVGRSFGEATVTADAIRAYQGWTEESRVYVIPGLAAPVRWQDNADNPFSLALAIGGNSLEAICLLHVGENGLLSGLAHAGEIAERRASELLVAWLNLPHTNSVEITPPKPIMGTVEVPDLSDDGVLRYTEVELERGLGPVFTIGLAEDGGPVLSTTIPGLPSPIFPDVESVTHYWGSRTRRGRGRLKTTKGEKGSAAVTSIEVHVRGVLEFLFPFGLTVDGMHHWMKMTQVAAISSTDIEGALRLAKASAAPYLSTAESRRAFTWFFPIVMQLGLKQAILQGGELGLARCRTLEQIGRSRTWKKKLSQAVPVTRAWGPIGLFWALMIDELENHRAIPLCKDCSWALKRTRKVKDYCGKDDNVECFKRRVTGYQRTSRHRRRSDTQRPETAADPSKWKPKP